MNAAALAIGVGLAGLCAEILARALSPAVRMLDFRNFAVDPVNLVRQQWMIVHHDLVGSTLRPGYRTSTEAIRTVSERLPRPLGPDEAAPAPPLGAILAYGDSFAYSSDVAPADSWPTQPERLVRSPVLNLGVGGHGIDQSALYLERTIAGLRPKVVVVSFIPPGIDRAQMSVFSGASKPFFEIDGDGTLKLRNVPVAPYAPSVRHAGWVRSVFGYLYAIDFAAARLGLEGRWRLSAYEYRRPHGDGLKVSCLLMARIAETIRAADATGIVLAQYGWSAMESAGDGEIAQSHEVLGCAEKAGLRTIDSIGPLREAYRAAGGGEAALRTLFVGGFGHMTPAGNALIARLLAPVIESARTQ